MELRARRNTQFRSLSRDEVRNSTRVLFIDDQRIDLIDTVSNNGWRVKYIPDLDTIDNTELIDSQVVCIDIIGIGKALGFKNEGLGVVRAIRETFPDKKIILYSSRRTHDLFDHSVGLVDRIVSKDGETYPFLKAIEELATEYFDWRTCAQQVYEKYRPGLQKELTFEQFEKRLRRAVRRGDMDPGKIAEVLSTSVQVAASIAGLVTQFSIGQ